MFSSRGFTVLHVWIWALRSPPGGYPASSNPAPTKTQAGAGVAAVLDDGSPPAKLLSDLVAQRQHHLSRGRRVGPSPNSWSGPVRRSAPVQSCASPSGCKSVINLPKAIYINRCYAWAVMSEVLSAQQSFLGGWAIDPLSFFITQTHKPSDKLHQMSESTKNGDLFSIETMHP